MRIITAWVVLIFFFSCRDTGNKRNNQKTTEIENQLIIKEDSLKLIKLLSANSFKGTSILVSNDSVYFVTQDVIHDPDYCSIEMLYYDLDNKEFILKKVSDRISYDYVQNNVLKPLNPAFHIKSIGGLKIKNATLTSEAQKNEEIKKLIKFQNKIQLYKEQYYFVAEINPQKIYSYISKAEKIDSFNLSWLFMRVTGFFLYDIDKDNNPEVFIFNKGVAPDEDQVSYTIYSIRRDFVAIKYKSY